MKEYILVTRASSGIGYETAEQLAAKNFNLILVAHTESELQQMQAELTAKYGIEIKCFAADLSDADAAIDLHKATQQENLIITHLVNNAGVGNSGLFTETSVEEELSMIQINISSLVVLTQLFAQDMVRRNSGRIMNVASVLSSLAFPSAVYSATKAYVIAFTNALAADLEGTGVSVLSLTLGTTDTDLTNIATQLTDLHKTKPMHPKEVATQVIKHLLEGEERK